MSETEQGLTIEELSEQTHTPIRTIRYYISQGLLAGPGARGKSALYRADHLMRLRLIRQLTDAYLPLQEIREMLDRMTTNEIIAMLASDPHSLVMQQSMPPTPHSVIASILQRAHAEKPAISSGEQNRAESARRPGSPSSSQRLLHTWRHWQLADGIEIHVREDIYQHRQKKILKLLDRLEHEIIVDKDATS